MTAILITLICVIAYYCIVKKNYIHPVVYFFGIFCIPLLFSIIDFYDSMIEISNTTIWILALGMFGFAVGTMPNIRFRLGIFGGKTGNDQKLVYRKKIIYAVLAISFVFNLFMSLTTIGFLFKGYAYSSIRDLMFGYSGATETFFKTTFLSTFNSWISAPCTYLIASIAVLEVFEKKMPLWMHVIMLLDVGMYIFATGGRLIVLTILLQAFFLLQYYKIELPKKMKKKILKIGILLVLGLLVMTVYRTKESDINSKNVSSIYSYFNIPIPILSVWVEKAKESGIYGYGMGFCNGIMEIATYIFRKVGIIIQPYEIVSEQLYLPQTKWLQIYQGHWYNAFCTLFYYFYVDFRLPGVFLESMIFGMICKRYYRKSCLMQNKKYLPAYLTILQVITMAFIRWQFGTLAHINTMVLALLCTKREEFYE